MKSDLKEKPGICPICDAELPYPATEQTDRDVCRICEGDLYGDE